MFAALQQIILIQYALPPCSVDVQITGPASMLSWSRSLLLSTTKR